MSCIEVLLPLALPMSTLTYTCDEQVAVGARVRIPLGPTKEVVGIVQRLNVEPPAKGELKPILEVLDALPLIGQRELDFVDWLSKYYLCSTNDVLRALMPHLFCSDLLTIDCRYFKPKKVKIDGVRQLVNVNIQLRNAEKLPPPTPQFPIEQSVTLLHRKQNIDLASLVATFAGEGKTVLVLAPTTDRAKQIFSSLEPYFSVALCSQSTLMKKRAALAVDLAFELGPTVIVGTKAAIGLGYRSLAAVIIDQEESYRYKSQRVPQLSVRDAALMLASVHGAKSVLISEFPAVESYYNAHYGQWGYLSTEAPEKELRSIVLEHGKELISKYLRQRIAAAVADQKRVVLMQNRRGIASYIECVACGHIPQCGNCSTSFTVHRQTLGCHYCGATAPLETKCPKCGREMEFRGRGTQRIEDQIAELYPDLRTVRIDSDAYADEHYQIDPDWQIAIGTRMVIESIDWQEVGVAAILNVDNMVSAPDFRATEDLFRTVGTMAARCREVGAELVVQSSTLGNIDVDDALNFRFDSFYNRAIEDRRVAIFPPHSRMIRLSFRGGYMADVVTFARDAEAALRPIFAHRLSPLYQPLVERQAGDHIIEMLLKIERGRSSAKAKELLHNKLSPIINRAKSAKVAISAESDPL